MTRTYTELMTKPTYLERFEYLKLGGAVGAETFGYDRYLNQAFYRSPEWKRFRKDIIVRDLGCDLAWEENEIPPGMMVIVHHINPITQDDILNRRACLFDPENAITVTEATHKAIHYGDASLLPFQKLTERAPNDTCPWR